MEDYPSNPIEKRKMKNGIIHSSDISFLRFKKI